MVQQCITKTCLPAAVRQITRFLINQKFQYFYQLMNSTEWRAVSVPPQTICGRRCATFEKKMRNLMFIFWILISSNVYSQQTEKYKELISGLKPVDSTEVIKKK